MGVKKDIKGMKFGRWNVSDEYDEFIKIQPSGKPTYYIKCVCDCGTESYVEKGGLLKGNTKSCGCLRIEVSSKTRKKYNVYDLSGQFGIGYDSNNREFYFDLSDYDKIKEHCWFISNTGYAVCQTRNSDGFRIKLPMHRLVTDCVDGLLVDHIDGNRNDNRKLNLRMCAHQENIRNSKIHTNNVSGVTGVHWESTRRKWRASIKHNGVTMYLGSHSNFEDAVKARKDAEGKYFGEYAYKER